MRNMDDCMTVWRMYYVEGRSYREISRLTGLHRKTIRKILNENGRPSYSRQLPAKQPKLGAFIGRIEEILQADANAPRKQRHTAKRIYDRLRAEGYTGGYTQVREYVRQWRRYSKEAYVPLDFGMATAQVDWGEAYVLRDGVAQPVHLFVMTLPYSGARFVASFPRETLEFFIEGHFMAFEFFGGVPQRIVYDNLKLAVLKILRRGRRNLNANFESFCKSQVFEPIFCNGGRGNEKGHVENGVKFCRSNFLTPLPVFDSWHSLNATLADKCRGLWTQRLRGHDDIVGERLEREKAQFYPITPWSLPNETSRTVNSLCLVRFDDNDYSVPSRYAYHNVSVRANVQSVRIYYGALCIAEHDRCHEKERTIYDPVHYLRLVERKPRTLDTGAPLKGWSLPGCFARLRQEMERSESVEGAGTREFIRVLRLLETHDLKDLTLIVQRALDLRIFRAEGIRTLLLCQSDSKPDLLDLTQRPALKGLFIEKPDPGAYSILVAGGAA